MDEIDRFLEEDLNGEGDVTSNALFTNELASARIIAKESAVLAGIEEAGTVFERTGATFQKEKEDGSIVSDMDVVASVNGSVKSILVGERLALNIIGRMSGIATQTKRIVDSCHRINPNVNIAATRKTTPGFRKYEKKAVELGGGESHRFGLFDAVMIKDNHIAAKGSFKQTIETVTGKISDKIIEVEVETEDQAIQAAQMDVDVIMLDNFSARNAREIAKKIKDINSSIMIEISGGITPENIHDYVKFADRISMGYLTHTIKNSDFSLDLVK
jgi:nicotinate-nucleotide pyrophosphorylase (carboxylating)